MRAFVNFFFKKFLLRNYWLDFYQISQECNLDRVLKLLFTVTEKSGLWGNTGAQVPLVCLSFHVDSNSIYISEATA